MKLFFILFLSTFSFAQSTFPEDWTGNYSGEMIIAVAKRANDTVQVNLELDEIIQDSIWSYKMTYNSPQLGSITKDYRFVSKQKNDRTNFILDEQNGIEMELTLMNNCFYGMYEVMGSIYTMTFRKHKDQLFFELYMAPMHNPKITSTKTESDSEERDQIIEAKSYKPTLVQSVMLKRN